jgi:outer membrane protein assembly factor BamD (BamD/ComL family)
VNSIEGLLAGLPLTPEKLQASNDSINNALVNLGNSYLNGLEEYQLVIDSLAGFPEANPKHNRLPEVLYMLYVSYIKTGREADAEKVLGQMQSRFAGDPLERQMTMSATKGKVTTEQEEMTRAYDEIYNAFIEGRFQEAVAKKKVADDRYGQHYWTPQLLYINAVYLIRQRQDAEAKVVLGQIIEVFRDSPMAEKAQNMLDVLNRRKEIEDYLTNLEIERPKEDEPVIVEKPAQVKRETVIVEKMIDQPAKQDSVVAQKKPVDTPAVKTREPEDVVKTKEPEAAVVKKDPPVVKQPVQVRTDSAKTNKPAPLARNYSHDPNQPHMVVMVTDKVDPVYISESKNAFNRYNSQRYSGLKSDNTIFKDDIKMLVISGFANAEEAKKYAADVRKSAPTTIIPWLPVGKYYFVVINNSNYELLQQTKTLEDYKKFEAQYLKD